MTLRRLVLVLVCVLQASCRSNRVEHSRIAGRDVAMWLPEGGAPLTGYPLIVFSHGFSGCNTQSLFLMEALAHAGYLVLAPNHHDARCGMAGRSDMVRPSESFRQSGSWNEQNYRDRAEDMEAVLNAVTSDKSFHGVRVDAQRIGLAGHSLGGYTVLGMAGAWPSWKDGRVKAVLALSPFCAPYIAKGDLGRMNVPVMYQGGSRDFGITPTVRRSQGAFDLSSRPKYYVEFAGAGHFAWTNLNRQFQQEIDEYSVAFFNRYLKKGPPDRLADLLRKPYPREVAAIEEVALTPLR